jgi:glyoxylase-like metal-dependent hydrolase (beta-lactamase superfamily II)
VTAGVIVTEEGTVVVDTLPFPSETAEIVDFVEDHTPNHVQFVINTHSHADHIFGDFLFPNANIIAHRLCRRAITKYAEKGLSAAQEQNPELSSVVIRFPNIVFESELTLRLGSKTIQLVYMPGHTADSIAVLVKEDRVLFAGDIMRPVPYIVWGDVDQMMQSLQIIRDMNLENIVQGHGEVLLRGEINETIDSSMDYLKNITRCVRDALREDTPLQELLALDIEQFGKSRIPLNGLVQQLHQGNLRRLYERMSASDTTKAN